MKPISLSKSDLIVFENITVRFGAFTAVKNFSCRIKSGEVVVIVGPSGSGKSTLLRTVAGLAQCTEGTLSLEGKPLSSRPGSHSKVGMLSQSFFLFPHLTVLENITLAPRLVLHESRQQAEDSAITLLQQLKVEAQASKYPHQLSGGQQQRVAIARALAMKPSVMLFDEPTSALDPEAVVDVLDAIRDLAQSGITLLIVTHQMGFAQKTANRVLFMDEGTLLEDSEPEDFFSSPRHERAKQFLATVLRY